MKQKRTKTSVLRSCQASLLWLGLFVWMIIQAYQYHVSSLTSIKQENGADMTREEAFRDTLSENSTLLNARERLEKDWNDALSLQRTSSLNEMKSASLSSKTDFFSACLIIKDDNHWLTEWIAYHYHVLDLRHLVLVSDPASHSSPMDIVNRWLDLMQIDVWSDDDFLPHWIVEKRGGAGGLWLHLNRQKRFYGKCLNHLNKMGRTWVTLTDSDEWIRINPVLKSLPRSVRSTPGHVLSTLNTYLQSPKGRMIETESQRKSLCLLAPRIQVTSIESNITEDAPSPFNSSDFLTYRFLYHNGEEMQQGKNIIRLDQTESLPNAASSVHHVLEHCPRNTPGETKIRDYHNIVQIQHYLGTIEQFTARDDPRDAVSNRPMQWHSRGRFPEATIRDDGMAAWLDGFIETHGEKRARELLQDVGKVEPNPHRNTTELLSRIQNATLVAQHMNRMQEKLATTESFSACLLTMDDSHWLVEWLAYHYHTLPLRKLTFVQDPNSRTDARHIFERWSDRMEIQEFVDDQFIPAHILRKFAQGDIPEAAMHRQRQKFFYSACLKDFKSRNATWVVVADVDEFIRPNKLSSGLTVNAKLPTLTKPGSLLHYLKGQLRADRIVSGTSKAFPCLYVPRLQMASKEISTNLPQSNEFNLMANATKIIGKDPSKLLTTRWFYHNKQEIVVKGQNLDGKNIIDVSQIHLEDIPHPIPNVHHILPDHCPASNGGSRINERETWMSINHYAGTYEQFSFRRDPRDQIAGRQKRNYATWSTLGQDPPADTYDEEIISWLGGFVDDVGPVEARRLLKDVGKIDAAATTRFFDRGTN